MNHDIMKFKGRNRTRLECIVKVLNDKSWSSKKHPVKVEIVSTFACQGPYMLIARQDSAEVEFKHIDDAVEAKDYLSKNLKHFIIIIEK